jgi:hypothetical protein
MVCLNYDSGGASVSRGLHFCFGFIDRARHLTAHQASATAHMLRDVVQIERQI